MHGWQSGAGRQRVDANPLRGEEGIAANIQRIGSALWGLGDRRFGMVVSWFLIGGDLSTAYTFYRSLGTRG